MDQINENVSDVETLIEELGIYDMDDDQLRQLQECGLTSSLFFMKF